MHKVLTAAGAESRTRVVSMGLLLLALFASGAAGLTYQVLWLRQLSMAFGVTAHAASTVLAGFMAGLACGSLLAGRLAGRTSGPLLWFAGAEAGIAVTGLLSPLALQVLPVVSRLVHDLAGDSPLLLATARLVVAFAVLVVPASFMGATLPLVVASAPVARGPGAASRVAAVYSANTAGAIAGVLVTGFVLVGTLGMWRSYSVAAVANLAASAIALLLARRIVGPEPRTRLDGAAGTAPAETVPGGPRAIVLVTLGVTGLAALALEVVWFRILVLFVPATTYAFTAMLAAVLGGIAAGGAAAARLLRRERDWLRTLTGLYAATASAALASLVVMAVTYRAGWRTSGFIQASVVTIAPTAVLMGMAFPIALRLWAGGPAAIGHGGRLARDLAVAYGVNVGGAIVGAIAGGFVLLPLLGSRAALTVCAGVYLACAAALAAAAPVGRRPAALLVSGVLAYGLLAAALPDPFLASLQRRHGPEERLVWRAEGIQTTAAILAGPSDRRVLLLDGLHQANDSPEMLRTHRELGHLPMVLHADPRRVLVIGLGGGATAGAVSRHASAQVDVVELSDTVRQAAGFFAHANDRVLEQPNVRLRVDDGRNYLLTTDRTYDVITADIIQPVHAGAGLLYSVEYFRLASRVLAPDGLMLQWVGHRPETQYGLMVRAFMAAFPHTTAWRDGSLLIGSRRPLVIRRDAFERRRHDPAARAALDAIGLDSFEALLSWYRAGPRALRARLGPGGMLTDDRPLLEYHRSLPREPAAIDLANLARDLGEIEIR